MVEPEVVEPQAEGAITAEVVEAIVGGFVDFGLTKAQLEDVVGSPSTVWNDAIKTWFGDRWNAMNESQLDAAGFMALKA